MDRFAASEIMTLTQDSARYDLAESVAPYLRLGELLDLSGSDELDDMALGYGMAAGNPRLREVVANRHGVTAEDVVITAGGMHALFLVAFILCEPGGDASRLPHCFLWPEMPSTRWERPFTRLMCPSTADTA